MKTIHVSSITKHGNELEGWALWIARFAAILAAALALSVFINTLPTRWSELTPSGDSLPVSFHQIAFAFEIVMALASAVLAALVVRGRPKDWVTLLVAVELFIEGIPGPSIITLLFITPPDDMFATTSNIFSLLRLFIGGSTLLGVLAIFPDGHIKPRWMRGVLIVGLIWTLTGFFFLRFLLGSATVHIYDLVRYLIYGIGAIALSQRYRQSTNSLRRQQTRWMITALVTFVFGNIAHYAAFYVYFFPLSHQNLIHLETLTAITKLTAFIFITLPTAFLIVALGVSILRYRLWDVDFFINRAVVYSALTATLGVLFTLVITFANQFLKSFFGNQSATLTVVLSALPLAAAFNPLRNSVQAIVDRYFKPEQVDFSKTFLEFSSDVRGLFTSKELMEMLTTRVAAQLNVAYASIFAPRGIYFEQIMPPSEGTGATILPLTEAMTQQLKKGRLAIPDEDDEESPFSILVPLHVPRHDHSEIIGILALGPRLSNKGYPTQVQNSLSKLGSDAGTAIYVAQLHESKKPRGS